MSQHVPLLHCDFHDALPNVRQFELDDWSSTHCGGKQNKDIVSGIIMRNCQDVGSESGRGGLTDGRLQCPAAQHLQTSITHECEWLYRLETSDVQQPNTSAVVLLTQLTERQTTPVQTGRQDATCGPDIKLLPPNRSTS